MRAECMGPQTFKNISESITVWRIIPGAAAGAVVTPVRVLEPRKARGNGCAGSFTFEVWISRNELGIGSMDAIESKAAGLYQLGAGMLKSQPPANP
jgi:hypothetical protein